jgi:hypothetical protein
MEPFVDRQLARNLTGTEERVSCRYRMINSPNNPKAACTCLAKKKLRLNIVVAPQV